MRNRALCLCVTAMAAALMLPSTIAAVDHHGAPQWGPDRHGGYPTTHILVKFQPGVNPQAPSAEDAQELDPLAAKWSINRFEPFLKGPAKNAVEAGRLGLDRWWILHVPAGTDTPAMVREYNDLRAHVELAELDGIGGVALTPNDPDFDLLWGMLNTGQNVLGQTGTPGADVKATDAWDIHTGTSNRTLAVVDSGVDPHPDFSSRLLTGFNTVTDNTDTSDACPHGTHVAGTAAAAGNDGFGVAGMNWGVNILPVRVLTGCSGNETDCAEGIIWAADNGANVITMSLQYYTGIQVFQDAVTYAHGLGVLPIAATGNNVGNTVAYPAKFPMCMGVGSTDNQDVVSSFSNFGPEIDVSAPGEDVYSTYVNDGFTYLSGTSMATPHVSGLATLIWSFNTLLTNVDIETILTTTADDLGVAGFDDLYGWGRINALSAMLASGSGTCGNDTIEPGEVCDGVDLAGETCASQGCTGGGTLACNAACIGFDTSACLDCPICDDDGVCEAGEDCNNCPNDCVSGTIGGAVCGNGVCEGGNGENCENCAADCRGRTTPTAVCCGDGGGLGGTTCGATPQCSQGGFTCTDTPVVPGSFCCGDLTCGSGEDCGNCALDCTLGSEVCSGGVDEDCDGAIDCSDGDCATDPVCTTCGIRADPCTVDGDCCSGRCNPTRQQCQ